MNIWYHLVQNVSFSCCYLKIYYCFSSYFHARKTLHPRVREKYTQCCSRTWPEERVCSLQGAIKRRLGKSATKGVCGFYTYSDIMWTIKKMRLRSTWHAHEEMKIYAKFWWKHWLVYRMWYGIYGFQNFGGNFATMLETISFSRTTVLHGVVSKVQRS